MDKIIESRDGSRLQRLVIYLILFNVLAVFLYLFFLRHLSFGQGLLVPALLIVYNLLLCKLVTKRARRRGDVHIIYLVVFTSIAACVAMLYYFFL